VKRRVLAIVIVLAVVACGSDGEVNNEPVRFATPAELTGPWRTTPLILDPALRARVAEACRRGIELPAEAVPAVIDARGGRVVTVRMTGATEGSCDALEIGESADVVETGGGWNGPAQRLLAVPDTELSHLVRAILARRNLPVEGWSVNGQAGAAIALVQVVVGDGLVVTATLENGWFSAWWPASIPDQFEFAVFPQVVIRAFDRTGALLDTAASDEVGEP
jgi:hypothetical protein